jgi:hypothetical protein
VVEAVAIWRVVLRGVVAVLVVVLAGAVSGAGQAYVIRTTPADTARASRVLLRWSDLPSHTFWRGGPVQVHRLDLSMIQASLGGPCVASRVETNSFVVSGQAAAEFKASNNSQHVESTVQLLESRQMLEQDWARSAATFEAKGLRCEQLLFNRTAPNLHAYRVARLALPNFGVEWRAFRVFYAFRQPLFGQRSYGIQDVIHLAVGRTESDLVIVASLGVKADTARRITLVDAAEERLIGIAAGRMRLAG